MPKSVDCFPVPESNSASLGAPEHKRILYLTSLISSLCLSVCQATNQDTLVKTERQSLLSQVGLGISYHGEQISEKFTHFFEESPEIQHADTWIGKGYSKAIEVTRRRLLRLIPSETSDETIRFGDNFVAGMLNDAQEGVPLWTFDAGFQKDFLSIPEKIITKDYENVNCAALNVTQKGFCGYLPILENLGAGFTAEYDTKNDVEFVVGIGYSRSF